ncbi:MAG: hypothetical protein NTZ74_02980 [Chloroflexi bacterium]|nr:hypothetical protein [Chloroflexota bacterium]
MKRKKKSSISSNPSEDPLEDQLERFKPLLSGEEYLRLQEEIRKPLLPAFRINPQKTGPDFILSLTERYGWTLSNIPYCPTGFRLENNEGVGVSSTVEHKTGLLYIQEAASMLPVELFSIRKDPENLTLDLAASPGGKTTHLIDRQSDTGLTFANDSSQGRIQALKIVLQHWGACSAAVTHFPGERFGGWFPNTFDRALIDAPCSMQGLRTSESHNSRPVTIKESRMLSQRQTRLLTSALQAVKPGGEVVYSTCTLLPEEDEEVVESILKKFSRSVQLLSTGKVLPLAAPGIQSYQDRKYEFSMENTVRFWPHRYHTAGFFACVFRKIDELDLPTSPAPEHSMEKAGFCPLSMEQESSFCRNFENWSGFPLSSHLESNQRVLIQRGERMFIFPQLFMDKFRSLPVQSAGILLGEEGAEGFIPSPEWTSRFGAGCQNLQLVLDPEQYLTFTQGEDLSIPSGKNTTDGNFRVVLDQQGRVLGRGKIVSDRVKNLSSNQYR